MVRRARPPVLARSAVAALLVATACVGTATPPPASRMLSRAGGTGEVRITVDGDRVTTIATPIDEHALPGPTRRTVEALAPDGRTLFCGEERGPRGFGYRVEKGYDDPDHTRSVLVDAAGNVLERWHSLDLREVPQHVLAPALQQGKEIQRACIVSDGLQERSWLVEVRHRRGDRFLVEVALDGQLMRVRRRLQGRVDS